MVPSPLLSPLSPANYSVPFKIRLLLPKGDPSLVPPGFERR